GGGGVGGEGEAVPIVAELPARVGEGQARLVHTPEVERGPAMRAELADEPRTPALAAEDNERLAEQPHALHAPTGLDLRGLHDGNPVAADEGSHRRAGARPGKNFVLFPGQHGLVPPGGRIPRAFHRPPGPRVAVHCSASRHCHHGGTEPWPSPPPSTTST